MHDFMQIKQLEVLYMTLIHSFLEYGSVIWNPSQDIYRIKFESVQHKC